MIWIYLCNTNVHECFYVKIIVIQEPKNILITGITGLVGSFVAKRFLKAGYQVIGLKRSTSDLSLIKEIASEITWKDGDILDVMFLDELMREVDLVVHAAAIVSFAPKDRDIMFKTNIEGTANIVNSCISHGVEKICFVSSVAAIGRKIPIEAKHESIITIDEKATWEESPLNSNYAKSKYLAEMEVWRGFSEGLSSVIVNPSLILGEADWGKSSTQLFKYANEEHSFYPKGTLNYVDIVDVTESIFQLMTSDVSGERFILNSGYVSYKDFFEKVATLLNKKPPRKLISKFLTAIIWRVEAVRSYFTGKAPLITKETVLTSSHHFYYANDKVKNQLGLKFKDLDETINRICFVLKAKYIDNTK